MTATAAPSLPPVAVPAPSLLEAATTAAAATGPLAERRAAGARAFGELGLPTRRNEDWHYTSVTELAETAFAPMAGDASGVTAETLAPYRFDAAWPTLVFVNGAFAPSLSNVDALPAGLRVATLADATETLGEIVEKHLGTLAPPTRDGFTALNTAFLQQGTVVHVGREMVVDVPLHLLHVVTDGGALCMQHPRVLVVAEPHAKAAVIESYVGLTDAAYFTNAVTELVVSDGATLHHTKVQREGAMAVHIGTIETTQGRDAHLVQFSFATGARLSRSNVYTVLAGDHGGATMNGLYMLDGAQHGDHQTRIEHARPACYSREVYKGVLDDRSHGVFNGKVYVHPIAQQTDGKQTNNTLLLSEQAQIDTKPQLEIFADDVKCTHGATVGQIDRTALFYMKSRGIDATTATQLLTYAFAADVLETIENDAIRDELERITLARFTAPAAV